MTLTPKERERLVRLERRRERQHSNSANRARTQLAINKLKSRQARRRKDFTEKTSYALAKRHGVIVFEDLNVTNMTTSARGTADTPGSHVKPKARLNRAILDRGWGALLDRTRDKASKLGGEVILVPAPYTSQTCCSCGLTDADSRTARAVFVCVSCGHTGHADVVAAENILNRALVAGLVPDPAGGTPVAAQQPHTASAHPWVAETSEPSGLGRGNNRREQDYAAPAA